MSQEKRDSGVEQPYGWRFHAVPLGVAALITVLFYAFVFIYVRL